MPQQELFFEEKAGDARVEVLKSYDSAYAREVFVEMDEEAQTILWNTLNIEQSYDPEGLPSCEAPDWSDFLWDELFDSAREDVRQSPSLRSYFIVRELSGTAPRDLYVSADWPSAEAFARARIKALQEGK
jgi:hypothetical protein